VKEVVQQPLVRWVKAGEQVGFVHEPGVCLGQSGVEAGCMVMVMNADPPAHVTDLYTDDVVCL
jgi:hypothetical protein